MKFPISSEHQIELTNKQEVKDVRIPEGLGRRSECQIRIGKIGYICVGIKKSEF